MSAELLLLEGQTAVLLERVLMGISSGDIWILETF